MPSRAYTRRGFLKSSALSLAGFGFSLPGGFPTPQPLALGRVTTSLIYRYSRPSFQSERAGRHTRDELLNLLEVVESPDGPAHNPRWYRVAGGYIHTAYVQRVEFRPPNPPVFAIPPAGRLAEVTAPFTQTYWTNRGAAWEPLYRLYYESVHWIKATVRRPDGSTWYRLADPKNDSVYYAPTADLRLIDPIEFSPTARGVPPEQKRIVISIPNQTVTAYEGETVVLQTAISSGVPTLQPVEGELPTDTPTGFYRITQKMPSRHMGDGRLTGDIDAYELPGVPWTMAFHVTGVALHGSYWHDNFGRPMSHGCVNMRSADALWLFRWCDPIYDPADWYTNGLGTLVQVF